MILSAETRIVAEARDISAYKFGEQCASIYPYHCHFRTNSDVLDKALAIYDAENSVNRKAQSGDADPTWCHEALIQLNPTARFHWITYNFSNFHTSIRVV